MRTLTFEQIEDTRFNGTKTSLELKNATLLSKLENLIGVSVKSDPIRTLSKNGEYSFRQRYYVQKLGRKTTWNDVYKTVNSVKAVPYDFTNLPPLNYANQPQHKAGLY